MPECIIVSAFIANVNSRSDRNIQKYMDYGRALMNLPIRKIVFMSRGRGGSAPFASRGTYGSPHAPLPSRGTNPGGGAPSTGGCEGGGAPSSPTTVLWFEKSDMYFNDLRDSITEFGVDTQHPEKDTLDYMFVQCHKTEWVAKAIEHDKASGNWSESNIYVWLDFGIRHMFRSDIAFEVELYRMRDRCLALSDTQKTLVYAAGCWNPNCVYYQDIYRQIHWVFAGSVFAGNTDALLEFAQRTKEKCLSIITQKRRLMWEVNVWYLVFLDKRNLFSFYRADHNASILSGLFL